MKQCQGQTVSGRKCRNFAQQGNRNCHVHGGGFDIVRAGLTFLGAAAGHAVLPGAGGALGGALISNFLDRAVLHGREKKKVFVSFDFDNDKSLKDALIAQSLQARSPFEVHDHSLQEAAPEREWKRHASAAIKRSDLVIVVVGRYAHRAHGVLAEVAMARKHGVPCIQLFGTNQLGYELVPGGGRQVRWTWDDLERVLG